MNAKDDLGREHRLQAEQGVQLRNCALTLQTGVQNVELSVAPATDRSSALQRVAPLADDPPQNTRICRPWKCIDLIEKLQIACSMGVVGHLRIGSGVEAFDDSQHCLRTAGIDEVDRKSTRLNSSHLGISYAVFCLKKKKTKDFSNPLSWTAPWVRWMKWTS